MEIITNIGGLLKKVAILKSFDMLINFFLVFDKSENGFQKENISTEWYRLVLYQVRIKLSS